MLFCQYWVKKQIPWKRFYHNLFQYTKKRNEHTQFSINKNLICYQEKEKIKVWSLVFGWMWELARWLQAYHPYNCVLPISYQLCSFWNQETHPNPRYSANLYWISEGRNEWTEIFRIFKWPDLVFNVVSFNYHTKCLPYVYVLNKTFHIIHLSTIILSIVAIWVYDFKIVVKFNKWLSVKCFWNLQVKKKS